jgi:hypothetical protein|tara:strand:+ start:1001 stop:1165 length:165 start_codon:yes stop_codon:yes gene_type:complete
MPKYTTLRLTHTELLGLLDSVEAVHPELRSQEENQTLDRLNKRINQALHRLEAN